MGYKKSAPFVPSDIDSNRDDVSVSELQAKITSDQEAANEAAVNSWTIPNEEVLTDFATSNRAVVNWDEGYPAVTTNVTQVKTGVDQFYKQQPGCPNPSDD